MHGTSTIFTLAAAIGVTTSAATSMSVIGLPTDTQASDLITSTPESVLGSSTITPESIVTSTPVSDIVNTSTPESVLDPRTITPESIVTSTPESGLDSSKKGTGLAQDNQQGMTDNSSSTVTVQTLDMTSLNLLIRSDIHTSTVEGNQMEPAVSTKVLESGKDVNATTHVISSEQLLDYVSKWNLTRYDLNINHSFVYGNQLEPSGCRIFNVLELMDICEGRMNENLRVAFLAATERFRTVTDDLSAELRDVHKKAVTEERLIECMNEDRNAILEDIARNMQAECNNVLRPFTSNIILEFASRDHKIACLEAQEKQIMGVLKSYRVELDELRAGQKTNQEAQKACASIVAPEQAHQEKRSRKAARPAVLRVASPIEDPASKSLVSHISELSNINELTEIPAVHKSSVTRRRKSTNRLIKVKNTVHSI